MSVPAHPHYDAMAKILPDFTAETGIKVELDKIAMGRLKDKQLLEMSKPQGDYDLGLLHRHVEDASTSPRTWSLPLEPFFANAALADPTYDIEDIIKVYLENLGLVGGPKGYLRGPGREALRPARTARRLRCSPTARTSSPSTASRCRENYDEFAEDPARRSRTRKASAHSPRAARRATSACMRGCCTSIRWAARCSTTSGSPRFNDKIGVEALKLLQGDGGHRPGGHPRLWPGRDATPRSCRARRRCTSTRS